MGDCTCAISGLPIGYGDEVRFLLLQSSPYNRMQGHADLGPERWYLRAPPIRASYDDYGRIGDINPEDQFIAKLWLDGLNVDMIEKGVGDNTYHDSPVRKNMTFKQLVDALRQHRVEVRRELDPDRDEKFEKLMGKFYQPPPLGKGIPSIERIEEVIKTLGEVEVTVENNVLKAPGGIEVQLTYTKEDGKVDDYLLVKYSHLWRHDTENNKYFLNLSKLGTKDGQLTVDEIQHGEVRVRLGGYFRAEESMIWFNPLVAKLQEEYAACVTCGTGGCADDAEISVKPKAGTLATGGRHKFSLHEHAGSAKRVERLQVRACMVREDVWQSLLSMEIPDWSKKHKIDRYQKATKEAWEGYEKKYLLDPKRKPVSLTDELMEEIHTYSWKSWHHGNDNPVGKLVCDNPSIGAFGMNTSWIMFAESKQSKENVETFLKVVGETAFVSDLLETIRMEWRPEENYSPQFGEWKTHRIFHLKMASCALATLKKQAIERKKDREWEKEYNKKQKAAKAKKKSTKRTKKVK